MSDHAAKPHLGAGTYDAFRNAALVYLPALGTLYFTIAQITGLPYAEEVVGILAALAAFLGIAVKVSKANYLKSPEASEPKGPADGTMTVTKYEDGDTIRFAPNLDLEELKAKDHVVLKVETLQGVEDAPSQ
jgi:hypothetical protein